MKFLGRLLSPENRAALAVALILILLTILSAGQNPAWIYQGF